MITQNTKNLNIAQIQRLIDNNGISSKGVEYCLEALKASLLDKQAKASEKYAKSHKAILDEANAYSNAFPPAMPVSPTQYIKPISKPDYTVEKFDNAHAIKSVKPDFNRKSFKFDLPTPMWFQLGSDSKDFWAAQCAI